MAGLAVGLGSILATGAGQKAGTEGTVSGSRAQAGIERLGREASSRQFGRQIARQQPFIDVGTRALPQFIESLSNRGDVSGLPATTIQSGLISDFLGDQAPQFVLDEALGNLEAVEAERNKGRLSDLINIGLGGVGSSAGSRVNLGTTFGRSIASEGNVLGQSLQDAATGRQNIANQAITSLGGIPAFLSANFQGRSNQAVPEGAFNPRLLAR